MACSRIRQHNMQCIGLVHMQPFVSRLIDESLLCLLLQGACEYEAD